MKPILVDEEKMGEHIYNALTDLGYAVTEEEAEDIAMIAFEYLVSLGMEVDE